MRKIVAISMPDEMHADVCRRATRKRYGSVSEYIRDLIRRDMATPVTEPEHEVDDDPSAALKAAMDAGTSATIHGITFSFTPPNEILRQL